MVQKHRSLTLPAVLGMALLLAGCPSPWPRIASAGGAARWSDGFRAESWYWGFAAAVGAFAITLTLPVFFGILAASLVLFWVAAARMRMKSKA